MHANFGFSRSSLRPWSCWLLGALLVLFGMMATALAAPPGQSDLYDGDGALVMMRDLDKSPDDNPGQGGQGNQGGHDDDDEYFTESLNISQDPDYPKNWLPDATVLANGDLAVAWGAGFSIYYDAKNLMFARSSDQGETWATTMALDLSDVVTSEGDVYNIWNPSLAEFEDGGLAIVWHGLYWTGLTYLTKVHFQRSDDGGETWTDPLELPQPVLFNGLRSGYNPAVIGVGDVIVVVYGSANWPSGQLYCITSTDGGTNWSDPVEATPYFVNTCEDSPYLIYNPVHDQLGMIVRSGGDVIFIHSDDLGQTWDHGVLVTDETASDPDWPSMAMGPDGTYYAVWSDDGKDQEVFFAKSSDGGVTWTSPTQVNDDKPRGNNYEAHVAVDAAGGVHVAWLWHIPLDSDLNIYYTYSDDGGDSWLVPNPQVNSNSGFVGVRVANSFDIAADADGNAYLWWWESHDFIYNIFFGRTADEEESRFVALDPDHDPGLQAVPNPFNPMTKIHFSLPKTTAVDLRVFNMRGQLVRTLASGSILAEGAQEILWNGKDDAGREVGAGVYFYQLQADGLKQSNRMTLVR